jgi:ribosomal protein S27AE
MARLNKRDPADRQDVLRCESSACPVCGKTTRMAYHNDRRLILLTGSVHYIIKVRRCRNAACSMYKKPLRPEAEGALALPHSEYGLDVLALTGALRYGQHRTVPEIHAHLLERHIEVSERTVTLLIHRYEELLALRLMDAVHLREKLRTRGQVMLAIDGLQPDIGHEVLWVLRDVLSGEVLLARALLGSGEAELAPLIQEVMLALGEGIPILGVISDGQRSIRNAVQTALPGVPHQLCQFHFLREAARKVYEADRHAKVQLKKNLRGIRKIERCLEARQDRHASVLTAYCLAVRSALTDDGRPPLVASGLRLRERITQIEASLEHVLETQKGGSKR